MSKCFHLLNIKLNIDIIYTYQLNKPVSRKWNFPLVILFFFNLCFDFFQTSVKTVIMWQSSSLCNSGIFDVNLRFIRIKVKVRFFYPPNLKERFLHMIQQRVIFHNLMKFMKCKFWQSPLLVDCRINSDVCRSLGYISQPVNGLSVQFLVPFWDNNFQVVLHNGKFKKDRIFLLCY